MPPAFKPLREKLLRAASGITERPDPDLEHVDDAFFRFMHDPDEIDNYVDDIEVRDAFLEFMQKILTNYTQYLKDPGLANGAVPDFANARDFFDFDKFRADRDATKSISFIHKLTHTNNFCRFIEARSLGKTENDEQIMHFDIQLKEKRTAQRRFLVQPFKERKVVKSMQVNEEGLEHGKTYLYETFPSKLDRLLCAPPRKPHSYASEDQMRAVHQLVVSNEAIQKMHEADWAKYMVECIYCLWFQVFAATLPMYESHSFEMISFARKLLAFINNKLKPLREVEVVYRRMFEACGLCMQLEQIKELYAELQDTHNFTGDKVTYGIYYQALLLCQRRRSSSQGRGAERAANPFESERKARYLNYDEHEYLAALAKKEEEKDKINNPNGFSEDTYSTRPRRKTDDDFDEIFDQADAEGTVDPKHSGNLLSKQQSQIKLSQVLEHSLYIEFMKNCPHCGNPLKEEELLSGLQKSNSDYTSKCPNCHVAFVPKVTLYSEYKTDFINGREGLTLQLLPPVALYKEFLNTLGKKGDRILTQQSFLIDHSVVFWNMIAYFRIMKLPCFILDQDYTNKHVKVQVSWINKYLPDKVLSSSSSKQATRSSFGTKIKLDQDGLTKLESQAKAQSPARNSSLGRLASGIYNKIKGSASKGPSSQTSGGHNHTASVGPQNESVQNSSAISNALSGVTNVLRQPSLGLINVVKSAKHSSGKSGSGSVVTSASDLERLERLMVFAKFANKSIIRHFGKQLEEFRREMQYSKEIILSELMIPESMIRHAENVNLGGDKQSVQLKQAVQVKIARMQSGATLDDFQIEEPQKVAARSSNPSDYSAQRISDPRVSGEKSGSLITSTMQGPFRGSHDLQKVLEDLDGPQKQKLPPKPLLTGQMLKQQSSLAPSSAPVSMAQKYMDEEEGNDNDEQNDRLDSTVKAKQIQQINAPSLRKLIANTPAQGSGQLQRVRSSGQTMPMKQDERKCETQTKATDKKKTNS